MPQQIIIGRSGNQPFPLNDPKISSRHAILHVYDGGQLQLVDTNSTNGTFIYNGQTFVRIQPHQPVNVTGDTMIQLGPESRFHVRKLLTQGGGKQPQPPKPQPKRANIFHLRKISERYTEKKMELETKSASINGLRSLTIVASLFAGTGSAAIAEFLGIGEKDIIMKGLLGVCVAVALIAVLLTIINNRSKRLIRERQENEHKYAVKYVCPECGFSFRNKIYENILSERRCPKCKTEFYEEAPRRR